MIALHEVRRCLRPGGYLLVRTNAQAFPRTRDDRDAGFHKYEPEELRGKLAGCSLSVMRLSRINALLGLAEIPRELQATQRDGDGYHGILARSQERPASLPDRLKRSWLRVEGRAVRAGIRLPLGRALLALCRAE